MKSVYFKLAPVLLVAISPAIIHNDVHGEIISLKKVTAYDFQPGIPAAITNYKQDVNGKELSCYELFAGKKRFFIVFNNMVAGEITAKNKNSRKGYPVILPVNEDIFFTGPGTANNTCSGFTGEALPRNDILRRSFLIQYVA